MEPVVTIITVRYSSFNDIKEIKELPIYKNLSNNLDSIRYKFSAVLQLENVLGFYEITLIA